MFKKRESGPLDSEHETEIIKMEEFGKPAPVNINRHKPNTIVKGSKLTGNIIITYDLELDGEVEGDITSEQKSNISMKGTCSGNLRTREGNVDIEGKMLKGDITAGGDIKITGSFNGGSVEAKGTIYVNGEFSGKLDGKDIEIGPAAKGKGELFYRESISIAKGARVEVSINRRTAENSDKKPVSDAKVVHMERPPVPEKKELKKID